jgi:RNA 2',3'-cyclic 3'-phosphodiesterase
MRLFVALTPPAEVVAELQAAIEPLRVEHNAMRWARPEQWHLTLAFLGEVDETARADLAERLARAASRASPLSLAVGGAGRFGDRVLWTRVTGDTEGLRRLAGSVRRAAQRAGLPVEDRPYRPHLTLARARGGVDLRSLVTMLAGFASSPWSATRLHLVRSQLGAGPGRSARYEDVYSWPLLGRAPSP